MNAKSENKRKFIFIAVAAIAIILAAAVVFFVSDCFYAPEEYFNYAMGSEIVAYIYGDSNQDTADTVFSRITVLDVDKISRKSEYSEIYRLNQNSTIKVSDEVSSYLKQALEICEKSGGALDVTIGGLSSLWDFDSAKNTVPEHSEIEKLKSYSGYEKVRIDGNTVTLGENQYLDLGAVGKGIACDTAKAVFEENNISRALISVGGTVMTYSDGKDYFWHDGWGIAVRTPEVAVSSPLLRIQVTETKVFSTSGNYEKYFEADGITYHHILDPETGYPAESGLKSVTIIADNGLYSDALSTACFVLGIEKSKDLLKEYNAEAIFVDNENNVYVPSSLIDSCTLLNDSYKVLSYE